VTAPGVGRILASIFLAALVGTAGSACRMRRFDAGRSSPAIQPSAASPKASPAPEIDTEAADLPADLTVAERRAVAQFLSRHADLRPAADGDAHETDEAKDVARLYGVYHPFFVRGDLNDDGIIDFAIAFVSRRKIAPASWFSVVVFFGDRRGGFVEPRFVEREISLADGDLSIDRDSLLITPDVAQDDLRRYRWNPSKRELEFVSGDDNPADRPPTNRI
jgi:hypothetical protein